MTYRLHPDACALTCRDVILGALCTSEPGTVTPIDEPSQGLCPPELPCTDAIVHRVDGSPIDWHTSGGIDWRDWLRARGVA